MRALSFLVCLRASDVNLNYLNEVELRDFVVRCVKEAYVLYAYGMFGDFPVDSKVFRTAPQEEPSQDRSPPNNAVVGLGEVEDGSACKEHPG